MVALKKENTQATGNFRGQMETHTGASINKDSGMASGFSR